MSETCECHIHLWSTKKPDICPWCEVDHLKGEVERLTGLLKDDSYLNGLLSDRDYMLTFMEQGVLVEVDELKAEVKKLTAERDEALSTIRGYENIEAGEWIKASNEGMADGLAGAKTAKEIRLLERVLSLKSRLSDMDDVVDAVLNHKYHTAQCLAVGVKAKLKGRE